MLNWREVWVMALGYNPPISYLPPVVSTVLIYVLVMVFCYIFYQLSKVFLPGFLQEYAQDFFKTLAFCTYCFGHGVVRNSYGHLAYCFLVVPLNTTTVFLFNHGDGNPVSVWSKYLRGQIPEWKFLVKVSVQILAGFSAWELGYIIFSLDFYDSFAGAFEYKGLEHCRSDLRIPALAGFLLEATGVTYDYWMNQQTLSKFRPLDVLLKFTNTAFIVCCGVRMTGMYMHPAMATGRGIGCGSTPIPYHLLVYWAGPFTGVFLGLKISKVFSLSSLISTNQKPESETKSTNQRPTQKKAPNHKGANGTLVRQRKRKKTYYSNGRKG